MLVSRFPRRSSIGLRFAYSPNSPRVPQRRHIVAHPRKRWEIRNVSSLTAHPRLRPRPIQPLWRKYQTNPKVITAITA